MAIQDIHLYVVLCIKKMYYETESCIFCQASASILSKEIKRIKINKFFELKEKFSNIFQSKDKTEKKIFKNFKIFFDKKYYNIYLYYDF